MFNTTLKFPTHQVLLDAALATLSTACSQSISKIPPDAPAQRTTPSEEDIPEVVISAARE